MLVVYSRSGFQDGGNKRDQQRRQKSIGELGSLGDYYEKRHGGVDVWLSKAESGVMKTRR